MSTQTSFAWCSDCGYIGPDFKTEEYLPYVDEGRKMSGGKTYECPKCGLTAGEQAIQEYFESLEARLALYGKSGCDLVVCNEPQRCGTVKELVAERDQLKAEKTKTQGILQERFQSLLSEWFKEPRVNFEKVALKLVGTVPWGIERDILWREYKSAEAEVQGLKLKIIEHRTYIAELQTRVNERQLKVEGLQRSGLEFKERAESLESRLAEAQGDHDIAEKLRLAKENLGIGICFMGDLDERAKSEAILEFVNSILESKVESLDEDRKKEIERMMKYGPDKVDPEPFGFGG